MTNTKITIGGRHDACIALRAPVVVDEVRRPWPCGD
ncbi:MAG: hypothetical protein ACLU38_15090 [Dysosmobacter sp.]